MPESTRRREGVPWSGSGVAPSAPMTGHDAVFDDDLASGTGCDFADSTHSTRLPEYPTGSPSRLDRTGWSGPTLFARRPLDRVLEGPVAGNARRAEGAADVCHRSRRRRTVAASRHPGECGRSDLVSRSNGLAHLRPPGHVRRRNGPGLVVGPARWQTTYAEWCVPHV